MKKVIEFVKQLEENKIIDKLEIDLGYQDEMRFAKGLLKFWIYEENPENKEYYIEVYKCVHKENIHTGELSGMMYYVATICAEMRHSEKEIIKILKEYIKRTHYNEQRVKFLTGRIESLTQDLSNKELCKKYPKICNAKTKKLEQFKNDLVIATKFYEEGK